MVGTWGEGWHEMVVDKEVIQVIRRHLGVPQCPCVVKWRANDQVLT